MSAQVLNEYCVTVTRKVAHPLTSGEARADVRDLMAWEPVPVTSTVIDSAFAVEDGYGLSSWDSLIVAAATQVGATHLLSEDLQHGQRIGQLIGPGRPVPDTASWLV